MIKYKKHISLQAVG